MGKIFVFRPHGEYRDAIGVAYAEDGEQVASHFSSSLDWFRSDMGLRTCRWHHDQYAKKYPDGYELVECIGDDALKRYIDSGELRGMEVEATE